MSAIPNLQPEDRYYRSATGDKQKIGLRITAVAYRVLRYGLVLVIGWIGMMKFTAYEAHGIEPLVAHSPFMRWMYRVLTVRQFSTGLGVVEVTIAILIALRSWSRRASAIGSVRPY
jgi:reactive chlorine resistance protein C